MSDKLARLIEAEVLAVEDDYIPAFDDAWDDLELSYWDDIECGTCGGRCVL